LAALEVEFLTPLPLYEEVLIFTLLVFTDPFTPPELFPCFELPLIIVLVLAPPLCKWLVFGFPIMFDDYTLKRAPRRLF